MTGNTEIRRGAMLVLENLQERQEKLEFRINPDNHGSKKLEEWMDASWCIELQLIRDSIASLKKQIIENEFNF